jgi:hypothetical protein
MLLFVGEQIEGSKYYQQVKWVLIKNAKYNLEELLATETGVFRELDMNSFIKFSDQLWNYEYWNDSRPSWGSLSYVDGDAVDRRWRRVENNDKTTFDQDRQWRRITAGPNVRHRWFKKYPSAYGLD